MNQKEQRPPELNIMLGLASILGGSSVAAHGTWRFSLLIPDRAAGSGIRVGGILMLAAGLWLFITYFRRTKGQSHLGLTAGLLCCTLVGVCLPFLRAFVGLQLAPALHLAPIAGAFLLAHIIHKKTTQGDRPTTPCTPTK